MEEVLLRLRQNCDASLPVVRGDLMIAGGPLALEAHATWQDNRCDEIWGGSLLQTATFLSFDLTCFTTLAYQCFSCP